MPDPDAKGTMIAAFKHHHMTKPMDISKHDHFNRIGAILDYIDMLPGDNDVKLTEQQRKIMFFKTHPRSWQCPKTEQVPIVIRMKIRKIGSYGFKHIYVFGRMRLSKLYILYAGLEYSSPVMYF
eukprot:jgi/Psemu1/26226/gm1.26226_g